MADGRPHRLCLTWALLVCLGWVGPWANAQTRPTYRPKPDQVLPRVEAAAELINQGQRAAGIRRLQAILERHPTHRQTLEVLAEVYLQDRRKEEAAELLARCIKKHSNSSRCRTIYSQLLLKRGDVKGAVALLEKAVAANSADAQAYLYLGVALLHQDNLDRAEVALNRALAYRKAGTLTTVHLQLAKLYSRRNRPLQEAQVLEWYLRENPDTDDAEQLRERIAQLRAASSDGQP